MGIYIDFQSIHSKWTIDAILKHMGFYVTTENPNVMMKENHNTQSCEYIILCQDGLYIASTTDRIPSTTPGAEPPRDAKDSGSARSHSTHLETSSSNRP